MPGGRAKWTETRVAASSLLKTSARPRTAHFVGAYAA